jgi:hypothetical protein
MLSHSSSETFHETHLLANYANDKCQYDKTANLKLILRAQKQNAVEQTQYKSSD